jgi:hypothetical protein
VAPVIFEAAKRISALCSGVGDGRNRWRGAGMNTRAPHKRVRRQKSKSIICGGIVMVISFQEIALAEGLGIRATARVFEVAPNTVLHWLVEAAEQLRAFSASFLCDLHLEQLQLDESCTTRRAGSLMKAPRGGH